MVLKIFEFFRLFNLFYLFMGLNTLCDFLIRHIMKLFYNLANKFITTPNLKKKDYRNRRNTNEIV